MLRNSIYYQQHHTHRNTVLKSFFLYQRRGYGTQALDLFLPFIRGHHPRCEALYLTMHPENVQAQHLYVCAEFRPTGAMRDGEPIYRLSFAQSAAGT